MGLAQTGSGKTAAFALPILQALLDSGNVLFALVVTPTRELAVQIAEQFEALGSGIGVRCAVLVGGVDLMSQSIALGKRPHILTGTPGRIVDHLTNTKGFNLHSLKYLVLDEADKLLDMDFEEELDQILRAVPKDRHTQLFSATMTAKVNKLKRACLKNPVKIEVSSKYSTVDTLRQQYMFIPAKHKECYLTHLLNALSNLTIIVFLRTCESARRIGMMLSHLGFGVVPIHGQMTQSKRISSLNKFKSGEKLILVATDVASRGLDIPSVDVVVNYDIPQNTKDYIHRVGRTARAGKTGRAITFVTQYDIESFQKIELMIDRKMEEFPTDSNEVLMLLERVIEALRLSMSEVEEFKKRKVVEADEFEVDELLMKSILNKKKRKKSKSFHKRSSNKS